MGYRKFSVVLLIVFLCQLAFSSSIFLCPRDQSISLLKFKQTLTVVPVASYDCEFYGQESYPKTSSWNMSTDCCLWDGMKCNEFTGDVIELDLGCSQLFVDVIDSNSSLFQLSHLQRLNLSWNNFSNSHISPNFGSFSSLTHLDLSHSYFSGQIPSEISHLSKLQSLSFSENMLRFGPHDFGMLLQNLTQLRKLDLSSLNISSTIPPNISFNMETLVLDNTRLYGVIPESIFHLPNLEKLDLHRNYQLSGFFPNTKWNCSVSLRWLDLDEVIFSSTLPESLGYLTSLYYLSLKHCNLWRPIPESLSNLTGLWLLHLDGNSLNGTIPSWIFSQFTSLSRLDLSNNRFSGQLEDFKSNSLVWIDLGSNQLQGHVPKSIQNLVNLTWIDLSYNNFSGNVDVSIFSDLKHLLGLGLSYNRISLTNENKVKFTLPESLEEIRLASCDVKELEFLRSAKHLLVLDLSNNKIQGRIPDWAWSNWMLSMSYLNLSHNMLTSSLKVLDLGRNNFTGEIPQCLGKMSYHLEVLDMHSNNLSGTLPTTFSIGNNSLRSLNLHDNELEGKIPRSLVNCKELQVLDLGNNHLNDTFPMCLRSNMFHGSIKSSRIENMFPELRIIDLSYNAFSGNLPASLFQHLKAMRIIDQTMKAAIYLGDRYYHDSITVTTKGRDLKLVRILTVYTTIDLSSNKFEGHIPSILGDLIALRVLNLSHNGLQGHMPPSVGSLSVVESFDLSFNQLSGEIPQQLASLTSLSYLNLSYNHLQGCIPQGPQFATFQKNSYEGNVELRGFPVSKGCGNDRVPETNYTISMLDDQESNYEFLNDFWKAALMGYASGLCIGLSIVYFMISTGNPKWLARLILELEHKIIMWRRKEERIQRNYRRNNRF
ncbi:unnamed protein product [Withania somnifera]